MKRANEMINDLAKFLDSQHKPNQPIRVVGSRRYLRQWFKAKVRGKALFAGEHELIIEQPLLNAPFDQVTLL